jgi:putative amino-acid transport system permease protein
VRFIQKNDWTKIIHFLYNFHDFRWIKIFILNGNQEAEKNEMFKISYFLEILPVIARKVNVTFELTIVSTIFALLVGVIVAVIGYYKVKGLYQITRVYVSLMRGTPIVAQLYFFYYGIALYSSIVRNMAPLMAVSVVMSLNVGAFMSESIRGALLSVDEGQKEAAYSLGMTNFQLVTRIVIPQAVRVALPPLFNDVINLIKMTSLAFMLGVPDIMGAAKIEGARTFRYFEIYAAVMLIYWVIVLALGALHKFLEKKCASMY